MNLRLVALERAKPLAERMPGNDLTRRSLLALVAGAGAASVADPVSAVAGLFEPAAEGLRLFAIDLGAVEAGVQVVRAPGRFDLVGVQWEGPGQPGIELRTLLGDGRWGRWAQAAATGHRPSGREAAAVAQVGESGQVGEPVWVGASQTLQLRVGQPLARLVLHLVDADGPGPLRRVAAREAAALPLAEPVLNAGPGQPPIIARRAWAGDGSPPKVAPEYGVVKLGFVHHTENPNGYSAADVPAMLRAIYVFHREVRGWNDIGYNFVVDLFGRIFEARAGGIDEPVIGAQAGGYNEVSTGVAVLGDFQEVPISAAARQALQRLLAWKLSLHGVPIEGHVVVQVDPAGAIYSRFPANAKVTLPRVAGHRDADATDCPGNVLYAELPRIRRASAALAGNPLKASMQLGPASSPGTSTTPEGVEEAALGGRLAMLDGSPISGAPIEVQARSVSRLGEVVQERTLATALTDQEGNWSLPVAVSHPAVLHPRYQGHGSKKRKLPEPVSALRALCPGGSGLAATISAPLEVQGSLTIGA